MPFNLRNVLASNVFQILIDNFRNGIDDILTLTYLGDLIILSEAFEKHLQTSIHLLDLQTVFELLLLFEPQSNREKCHFASPRVKYEGVWIT
ncbi:retrovirus-related Pol polyprotein from transposon opus [Caerostris extrusa]|uniref:Retrovirus-related Pol polyprotein from transposon opus n=1 Tax=Caerostris extrusa TaxID=172846 RepID=A0AAV4NUG5_CAEEX|nr:retrovirus-related Pol polyprotein from transposon opus [Caerostris extrusa]